jgi:hypothetical protein
VFTRGPGVPSPPKAILGDKISQNMRNHHQLHQLHQLPAVRYQGFVSFILLVHNSGKNEWIWMNMNEYERIVSEKMWSVSFCSSSCFIRLHTRRWVAQWIFQPQLSSNTVKAQLPKKTSESKGGFCKIHSDLGPLRWFLLRDQSMGCHTRCSCPHVCTEMWWDDRKGHTVVSTLIPTSIYDY